MLNVFAEAARGRSHDLRPLPGVRARLVRYESCTSYPLHAHETSSIALLLVGELDEYSPLRPTFRARPGDCLVKPAGSRHANDFGRMPVLTFQLELRDCDPASEWLDAVRRTGHSRIRAASLFRAMTTLLRRLSDDAPGALERTSDALLDVCGALASHRDSSRRPDWLTRAEREIADRLPGAVRVGDIADALNLHPGHLTRAFHAAHGCGLLDYVRRQRVQIALQGLAAPRAALCDVALNAGFCDQAHLTRAFRGVLGLTPGAVRRLIGTDRSRCA